ncbi:hypothetical protein L1987_00848 [Smallanthus sonchifolius]|uniref:Uncharacterized protein n=1 Tax=Smallanthus sonchifolius TaxID=185202 RepID=A0ACB9K3G3_9ASTR|nr:hypothetical protein L1987_00848 [Smallanthus sonchifolius]
MFALGPVRRKKQVSESEIFIMRTNEYKELGKKQQPRLTTLQVKALLEFKEKSTTRMKKVKATVKQYERKDCIKHGLERTQLLCKAVTYATMPYAFPFS